LGKRAQVVAGALDGAGAVPVCGPVALVCPFAALWCGVGAATVEHAASTKVKSSRPAMNDGFVLVCTIRAVIMMYSPMLEDTHTLLHIQVVVTCLPIFAPHATWSSVHPKSRKHWQGNTSNILSNQAEFCSLDYTGSHTQQRDTNTLHSIYTPESTSFFRKSVMYVDL
jgi:hypothetical protein